MFKTTVKINGMMCHNCENHMTKAFEKSLKTKSVEASHANGECVIISADAPEADAVKKIVEETGYEFVSMNSEPYEKKFSLFGKK